MTPISIASLLQSLHLRDTQPRRLVIEALQQKKKPLSVTDIQKHIRKKGAAINMVTIYRVIAVLEQKQVLHRHGCDGHVWLCSLLGQPGHHVYLHCTTCGQVTESVSSDLCDAEEHIAHASGFHAAEHVSELIGICRSCRP